jgi:hypothetical protein
MGTPGQCRQRRMWADDARIPGSRRPQAADDPVENVVFRWHLGAKHIVTMSTRGGCEVWPDRRGVIGGCELKPPIDSWRAALHD